MFVNFNKNTLGGVFPSVVSGHTCAEGLLVRCWAEPEFPSHSCERARPRPSHPHVPAPMETLALFLGTAVALLHVVMSGGSFCVPDDVRRSRSRVWTVLPSVQLSVMTALGCGSAVRSSACVTLHTAVLKSQHTLR